MIDNLPEEITNALQLLDASFGSMGTKNQVQSFKNAVYLLNDCMDDFPVYREDILKIKYSYTVRLLCGLPPNPDYQTWLEFVMLLCIDLKDQVKTLKNADAQLFETILIFLRLYEPDAPPTFQENITQFIDEITQ